MVQLKITADKTAMSEAAAERVTWLVEKAIVERGMAAMSLTGGTTPASCINSSPIRAVHGAIESTGRTCICSGATNAKFHPTTRKATSVSPISC